MEQFTEVLKKLAFFISWPIIMSLVTLQSFRPLWEKLIDSGIISKIFFILLSPIFIVTGMFLSIVHEEWEKLGE